MSHILFHSRMPYTSHWLAFTPAGSIEDHLHNWWLERNRVYDADTCGSYEVEIVVRAPDGQITMFKLEHAWWISTDPEWEMMNEIDVRRVDAVDFRYPTANRDWMRLST